VGALVVIAKCFVQCRRRRHPRSRCSSRRQRRLSARQAAGPAGDCRSSIRRQRRLCQAGGDSGPVAESGGTAAGESDQQRRRRRQQGCHACRRRRRHCPSAGSGACRRAAAGACCRSWQRHCRHSSSGLTAAVGGRAPQQNDHDWTRCPIMLVRELCDEGDVAECIMCQKPLVFCRVRISVPIPSLARYLP